MAPRTKNEAAVAPSKQAAKGRLKNLTPMQRGEIARSGARARWARAKKPLDAVPWTNVLQVPGRNEKELAVALGVSLERLVAVLDEARLQLCPKKAAIDEALRPHAQKGA